MGFDGRRRALLRLIPGARRVLKFLYFPEKALHSAKKSLAPEAAHP